MADTETDKGLEALAEAIKDKSWREYNVEIGIALENLYRTISRGNSGWIDYNQRNGIEAIVDQLKAHHYPRLLKQDIQTFIKTYDKLRLEFPQLQEQAYQEGADSERQDG